MELLDVSLQSEETQKCSFQYLRFLHTFISVCSSNVKCELEVCVIIGEYLSWPEWMLY